MKIGIPEHMKGLELIPLRAVQELLAMSRTKLYEVRKLGLLQTVGQHGRRRYVTQQALRQYLEEIEMVFTQAFPYRAPGMPPHPNELTGTAEMVQQMLANSDSIEEVQNYLRMIIKYENNPSRKAEWQQLLSTLPAKLPTKPAPAAPTKPSMTRKPLVQPVKVAAPVPTVPALPPRRKPLA